MGTEGFSQIRTLAVEEDVWVSMVTDTERYDKKPNWKDLILGLDKFVLFHYAEGREMVSRPFGRVRRRRPDDDVLETEVQELFQELLPTEGSSNDQCKIPEVRVLRSPVTNVQLELSQLLCPLPIQTPQELQALDDLDFLYI